MIITVKCEKLLRLILMTIKPHYLIMVDALGAVLSATLLGVVLVAYQPVFGIPTQVLYCLAALPCVFALYDCYVLLNFKKNLRTGLKTIAVVNSLYCLLSLSLAAFHYQELTVFGWFYIATEILVVLTLARIEWKVAGKLKI